MHIDRFHDVQAIPRTVIKNRNSLHAVDAPMLHATLFGIEGQQIILIIRINQMVRAGSIDLTAVAIMLLTLRIDIVYIFEADLPVGSNGSVDRVHIVHRLLVLTLYVDR